MLKYGKFIVISILSVLTPIKPLLLTIGFLIASDFLIGLYRAWRLNEDITSRKMGHTLSKLLLYTLTIICVYFFEAYILQSGLPLAKIVASLIGLIELKSIDESVYLITGFSFYKKLVNILKRGQSETKDLLDNPESE